MRTPTASILLGSLSALALAGCLFGGEESKGSKSAGRIALVPALSGKSLAKVGSSGADGLESFGVAVSHIMLVKDLQTNGSGWSGYSGPLPLYQNDFGDHNSVDADRARSSSFAGNYIDFCSQADLGRIATSQPFTLKDTGDYHFVMVNWSPYFKVRATIPLSGGDTLYTQDGPITRHTYENSADAHYYITRAAGALTQGPAADAYVKKNNGGTYFRFLRPLRLTADDLDTTALIPDTVAIDTATGEAEVNMIPSGRWNVLLVFNPEDLLFGGLDDSSNSSIKGDIRSADDRAYFNVPFLKATAVPYRDGAVVTRETYEFPVTAAQAWASGTYTMRLELYLIGDNVVAATVLSSPADGSLAPPEVPTIFYVEEEGDGDLDLLDWEKQALFDGFARKAAVGQTGTVQWNPGSHGQPAQSLSYTLIDRRRMN